jgi:CheY-like chemotaxis protein
MGKRTPVDRGMTDAPGKAMRHGPLADEALKEAMMSLHIRRTAAPHAHEVMRLRPLRILLAEDDREMRRLITTSLSDEGFEVIEASDGKRLLDLIASQLLTPERDPVDLVISDLRMPGPTGLEVLAGLRNDDWATPFILITAFGDEETHEEARRLGAVAVFDKPFDLDDLKTAIVNFASEP